MYITWPFWPSPGIDPRTPTVSGWSAGLHTSMVAHSCVEESGECLLVTVFVAGDFAAAEAANVPAAQADVSATSAAAQQLSRFAETMLLKIPLRSPQLRRCAFGM
jgi:hypothetical protein